MARLEREGLLAPAGIAAIEVAKENGSWTALDAVERLEEPPDLPRPSTQTPRPARTGTASARPRARGFSGGSEREAPETRVKRVEQTARMAAKGLRAQFDRE